MQYGSPEVCSITVHIKGKGERGSLTAPPRPTFTFICPSIRQDQNDLRPQLREEEKRHCSNVTEHNTSMFAVSTVFLSWKLVQTSPLLLSLLPSSPILFSPFSISPFHSFHLPSSPLFRSPLHSHLPSSPLFSSPFSSDLPSSLSLHSFIFSSPRYPLCRGRTSGTRPERLLQPI